MASAHGAGTKSLTVCLQSLSSLGIFLFTLHLAFPPSKMEVTVHLEKQLLRTPEGDSVVNSQFF